jgi:hypothetical protein
MNVPAWLLTLGIAWAAIGVVLACLVVVTIRDTWRED